MKKKFIIYRIFIPLVMAPLAVGFVGFIGNKIWDAHQKVIEQKDADDKEQVEKKRLVEELDNKMAQRLNDAIQTLHGLAGEDGKIKLGSDPAKVVAVWDKLTDLNANSFRALANELWDNVPKEEQAQIGHLKTSLAQPVFSTINPSDVSQVTSNILLNLRLVRFETTKNTAWPFLEARFTPEHPFAR